MSFFKKNIDGILRWFALHPAITRLSVTKKVVLIYGLIASFSMIALFYAMLSLHRQMTISTDLVHRDAQAVALARDLQGNLASQERLEKQFLLLHKNEIRDLMFEKYAAYPRIWSEFLPLLQPEKRREFSVLYRQYRQAGGTFEELLQTDAPLSAAEEHFNRQLLPVHLELYQRLETFK